LCLVAAASCAQQRTAEPYAAHDGSGGQAPERPTAPGSSGDTPAGTGTGTGTEPGTGANTDVTGDTDHGVPPDSDTGPPAADGALPMRGFLRTSYRDRNGLGESDRDLTETLSLDLGAEGLNPVSFHLLGRVADDLDGRANGQKDSTFYSLDDTKGSSLTGRIYQAYLEWHAPTEDVGRILVGRQPLYDTPDVFDLDGVRVETPRDERDGWRFGAYGGVPVDEFEPSARGDSVLGGFMEAAPWTTGTLRFDALHVHDDRSEGDFSNDVLGLGLGQALGAGSSLDANASWLDGSSRDLRLTARHLDAEDDFSANVSYYELLHTQHLQAAVLDPFTSVLYDEYPYRQMGLLLSKGLTEDVQLSGGVDRRRVTSDDDIGDFNRDFERSFLQCTVDDAGVDGLSVGGTGEIWNSPGSDIATWGLDLSQRLGEALTAAIGSYYSLYKYALESGKERDDVRTTYLEMRYRISTAVSIDMRYEFEDDDSDDFHVFRIGSTWRF